MFICKYVEISSNVSCSFSIHNIAFFVFSKILTKWATICYFGFGSVNISIKMRTWTCTAFYTQAFIIQSFNKYVNGNSINIWIVYRTSFVIAVTILGTSRSRWGLPVMFASRAYRPLYCWRLRTVITGVSGMKIYLLIRFFIAFICRCFWLKILLCKKNNTLLTLAYE